jgi:hypothetical protein
MLLVATIALMNVAWVRQSVAALDLQPLSNPQARILPE